MLVVEPSLVISDYYVHCNCYHYWSLLLVAVVVVVKARKLSDLVDSVFAAENVANNYSYSSLVRQGYSQVELMGLYWLQATSRNYCRLTPLACQRNVAAAAGLLRRRRFLL